MNNRIFSAMVLAVVIAANIVCVHRAWVIADGYPFKSLPLGTNLHFSVVFSTIPEGADSIITEINGTRVSGKEKVLDLFAERKISSITYQTGAVTRKRAIETETFNSDIFAFVIFILICGNIHCLMGTIVRFFFPEQVEVRYFSRFTSSSGFFLLALSLFLVYPSAWTILVLASIFFTASTLAISTILSRPFKKKRRLLIFSFEIICVILAMLVSGVFLSVPQILAFSGFMVVGSFLWLCIMAGIRLKKNRKIPAIPLLAMCAAVTASLIVPFTMIALSFISRVGIPLSVFSSVTIFMPVVAGSNIIGGHLRALFIIRKRDTLKFIFNILISFAFAGAVYLILLMHREGLISGLEIAAILAIVAILFSLRRWAGRKIQLYGRPMQEYFTLALRKISEEAASPSDLKNKVEYIFEIMKDMTDLSQLRIELFEKIMVRRIEEIPGLMVYSGNDELRTFLGKNAHILYRNSLFSSAFFELFEEKDDGWVDLIIPVKEEGCVLGVLKASGKRDNGQLAEEEVLFLYSASILMYHLIENEVLYLEYAEKRRYEKEIDIASYLQMRIYPKDIPSGKGFSCGYLSRPYIKVTGDYFDFVDLDENRTLFAIGDVAGHGLSAATLLAATGHIVAACVEEKVRLEDIFAELNDFFASRYRGTEIMTLFMMLFDRKTRSAEYINAGHCMPVMLRAGKVIPDFFPNKSFLLGAVRTDPYLRSKVQLEPGDEIIMYTDGIVEIQKDHQGNNIGDIFLIDVLSRAAEESIEEKIELLGRCLEQFPRNSILDDITVLGLHID